MIKFKRTYRVGMLVVAFILWGAIFAGNAEARLRDYLKISRGLTITTTYDDNIFLEPRNGTDGFEVTILPSVGLVAEAPLPTVVKETSRHRLEMSYQPGFLHMNFYAGRFGDRPTHNARIFYRFRPREKTSFWIDNTFVKNNQPALIDPYGDYTSRKYYEIYTASPALKYEFTKKTAMQLDFQYKQTRYEKEDLEDSEDFQEGLTLFHTFSKRMSGSLGYTHSQKDSKKTGEKRYSSNALRMSLERELSKKLTSEIGLGYEWKDVKTTSSDVDDKTFSIGFKHNTSPRTDTTLSYKVRINDTADGLTYRSKGVNFGMKHKFTKKISSGLDLLYQSNPYYYSGREDELLGVDISVSYQLTKKLATTFKYIFRKRESNDGTKDYTRDRFILSTALAF